MKTSQRLKYERRMRGWTQQDIARRIDVSPVSISRWENGQTHPSPFFRQRLCELFGRSHNELFPNTVTKSRIIIPDSDTRAIATSTTSNGLRFERLQRGWSQAELAKRIGTTRISVNRWECGHVLPSPYYLSRLLDLLGKTHEELFPDALLEIIPPVQEEVPDESSVPPLAAPDEAAQRNKQVLDAGNVLQKTNWITTLGELAKSCLGWFR